MLDGTCSADVPGCRSTDTFERSPSALKGGRVGNFLVNFVWSGSPSIAVLVSIVTAFGVTVLVPDLDRQSIFTLVVRAHAEEESRLCTPSLW